MIATALAVSLLLTSNYKCFSPPAGYIKLNFEKRVWKNKFPTDLKFR